MSKWITPVALEGDHIILEPMSVGHIPALQDAVRDGELWKLWYTHVPSPESAEQYVREALDQVERQGMLPFVVRHRESEKIIGSTRFCNIEVAERRLEIGYTWYAKSFQRTPVNTECKLRLLQHAFETLGVIAVEFRTHWHNRASRAAIARLGAKQDGVLRNHRKMPDGSYRDTVVFSIIDSEWPAVKKNLRYWLEENRSR